MKQKTFVRAVCLLLAVLMVMGVMVSALSTLSSAAVIKKKNSVHTARQPDLTFYDLEGNVLGTFSHAASSDLIGFNGTRVIYIDENGEEVETNYGRVDVTLHLCDGTGKYSEMTTTRENSYYVKYNMGSSTGEAFSNRITCSKGEDDTINLDVELPNVVFRDSNEMKMNIIYQYPYQRKSATGKTSSYIRTRTETLTFAFSKAKIDLTVTKPKKNTVTTDSNTGSAPSSGYGDKDQLDKDKTLSGTVSVMQTFPRAKCRMGKTQTRVRTMETTTTARTMGTAMEDKIMAAPRRIRTPAAIPARTAAPTSLPAPCSRPRICCCRNILPAAARWQRAASLTSVSPAATPASRLTWKTLLLRSLPARACR